jgi:DNA mismatch repair protein MutS2
VPVARLRPRAHLAADEVVGAPSAVRVRAAARSDVSDELDVRGKTGQEAREAVRAFIDDASLAGLAQVRVVHGRGTGAVRKAVRDELAGHPLAGSTESDSGDGATIVRLDAER